MKSIVRSLSILSISTFLFLFISTCQQQPNEPATSPNQNEDEKVMLGKSSTTNSENLELSFEDNGGGKKGEDSIGIKALPCNMLVKYYWEVDHYENIPGKIVGINPHDNRLGSVTKLQELRTKWGFNYLGLYETQYSTAQSAGYTPANLMLIISPYEDNTWINAINNNPTSWGYYVDELVKRLYYADPWRTDIRDLFINVRNVIKNKSTSSLFIEGETDEWFANWVDDIVDVMTCTRYDRDLSDDQRPLWDDFRSTCGSKFSQTWISARLDYQEYYNLLGHARNMGLQGVWLYQNDESGDLTTRISEFSSYAWQFGWLRRFDRKWEYGYECIKADPCGCDPTDISDGWIFSYKRDTGEIREL